MEWRFISCSKRGGGITKMIEKKDREKRTEDLKSASVWSQSCTWYFRLTGHKLALAGLFKIAACKRYFIYIYIFSPSTSMR